MVEYLELIRMTAVDNIWYAGSLFVILYIVSTVFSLPGASALTISSGAIFGLTLGGALSAIGAWTGAVIIFGVVKYFRDSKFAYKLYNKLPVSTDELEKKIEKHEFKGMLVMRTVPVFPFFAVNVLAGILKVSNKTYMTTTAIGMIWSFVYAGVGAGVLELAL